MKNARTTIAYDDFSAIPAQETVILVLMGGSFAFGGLFKVGGEGGEGFPFAAGEGFFVDCEAINHDCSLGSRSSRQVHPLY